MIYQTFALLALQTWWSDGVVLDSAKYIAAGIRDMALVPVLQRRTLLQGAE